VAKFLSAQSAHLPVSTKIPAADRPHDPARCTPMRPGKAIADRPLHRRCRSSRDCASA
jgi:hypothetical protein